MDDSLNLGKVDPPVWQVMISGKVYGPYTRGQLLAFIAENRIRPRTKIAKGDGAQFIPAEEIEDLVPALREALTSSSNHGETDQETDRNYVISLTLTNCGDEPLVRELNQMGFFVDILPGTYLLRSQMSVKAIRDRLASIFQPSDQAFIADTSSNRFASINLPLDREVHLREIWNKKTDAAA